MIIIGSRCGGYNFYACLIGLRNPLYLGPNSLSDLDILALRNEKIPKSNFKIDVRYLDKKIYDAHEKKAIFRNLECPFFTNKLNMPDKNDYLKFSIAKRTRFINPEILWLNKNKIIPILDKNFKHFDYIKLCNFN